MSNAQTKILKLNAQGPPPINIWLKNVTRMLQEGAPEGLYQEAPAGPPFIGDLCGDAPPDPQGEECVSYVNALKCCKAFNALKDLIGADFSSVDDWFINWARYVSSPHALLDAESDKQELTDRRLQYSIAIQSSHEKQRKRKVYTLSPRSLIKYTNAFMHVYCRRSSSSGFYVHDEYMMPPKACAALGLEAERATPKHLGTPVPRTCMHALGTGYARKSGEPLGFRPKEGTCASTRAHPPGMTSSHAGGDQPSRCCPGPLCLGATSQV